MACDENGIEAQPLLVPDVTLADGSTHEVIYLATMANRVFAIDIDTRQDLWPPKTLGRPACMA